MKPLTIAIAGASGSGKSTLTRALIDELNHAESGTAIAVPIDAYYRDLSHLSFDERDAQNFDHPDALELELLAEHLRELRVGRGVMAPIYDFSTHTRTSETQFIPSASVIIVEGILALSDAGLKPLYDFTVFVEAPLDVCLARRIERDRIDRGRDEASVRRFWEDRVLPMFLEFGEPAREAADLKVSGALPAAEGVAAIRKWMDTRASKQ